MARKEPVNPFYVLLILVGIVFCVSACAYGVMAYRGLKVSDSAVTGGLIALMEQRGGLILAVELAALAAATVGAIGLDEIRSRRAARLASPDSEKSSTNRRDAATPAATSEAASPSNE